VSRFLRLTPLRVSGALVLALAFWSRGNDEFPTTAHSAAYLAQVVDEISLIEGLPPKVGEPLGDPHAVAIVLLGREAAPYLAERITDDSPSLVVYGFQYKLGDLALVLLNEIYRPRSWPFPDDSRQLPRKHGDFRDYLDFVNSPGGRQELKEHWMQFIQGNLGERPRVPSQRPPTPPRRDPPRRFPHPPFCTAQPQAR